MNKIWSIVRKEWGEVFRNRLVMFSVSFMPLILTALPLIMLSTTGGEQISPEMVDEFGAMLGQVDQLCGPLNSTDCAQYLILQQFMVLFLIMPVMIPVTIAAYSIVGEKTASTLEPLLATPISTVQLLAGKALAAALPAIFASLLSFLIFAGGTYILASPAVAAHIFQPLWLVGIFIVGPLLSVASVSFAVMISSRVNDPRVAEQVSALVMLPVMGLFLSQIFGVVALNLQLMTWIAAGLVLVDLLLLFFATQLFERENILTRWK